MNFDPNILNQLSSMDPKELSDKIDEISRLIGVDSRRIKQLVGDPEELGRRVSALKEEDIRRITEKADPELIKKLKQQGE